LPDEHPPHWHSLSAGETLARLEASRDGLGADAVERRRARYGANRLPPPRRRLFTDDDRQAYLVWLKEYSHKHHVEVLAYRLMTNHVYTTVRLGASRPSGIDRGCVKTH
jgi:Cation transporter/ATPase, N-terminus